MKAHKLLLTASAALGLALSINARADVRTWNFDDWNTGDSTNLVIASGQINWEYQQWSGGNPSSGGYLQLTPGSPGRSMAIIFPDIDNGAPIKAFKLEADLRVGNGTQTPADGFSISYVRDGDPALTNATGVILDPGTPPWYPPIGRLAGYAGGDSAATTLDPAGSTNPESGTKTGVSVAFDAWAGNWMPDTGPSGAPGPDGVGVFVRVDDKTLTFRSLPNANTNCLDPNSMQTGPYTGDNSNTGLDWCKLSVEKTADNKVTVIWKGTKVLDNYQLANYSVHKGRIILAGRCGDSYQNVNFDNITLTTVPAIEATFDSLTINSDLKGWTFKLSDTGPSAVTNVSSVIWNGVDVTASVVVSKAGSVTTGVYTQPARLPSGSANQVVVTYKTAIGQTLTGIGNANTPGYFAMPPAYALPLSAVSTASRGIALGQPWQTVAVNGNSQGNNKLNWTEEQILGLHGANLITGPAPTSIDVLDYQNNNTDPTLALSGNFRYNGASATPPLWDGPDYSIWSLGFGSNPTKTSTDDGTIEWSAYVNFPTAGTYYVVVNSDDGFRLTTARHAKDRLGDVISFFNDGRGNGTGVDAGTIQRIEVDAAGVYPIRGIIENQGGGFNVEWYTRDGSNLMLVNSAAVGALEAWQSATGAGAYVQSAIPVRDAVDVPGNQRIIIDLANGGNSVNVGSIVLKVDGVVKIPAGSGALHMELAPVGPGGLWAAGSKHTNELTFTDSASVSYTYKWSYTIANYAALPVSLLTAPGSGSNPGFQIQMWQKSPLPASPNPENIINGWRNMLALGNQLVEGFYPTNAADMGTFTHNGNAWDSGMINYAQTSAGALADNGNFRQPAYPDKVFPGIPGLGMTVADNEAGAFRFFVEFPAAGYYNLGVNSDDGFRLTFGDSMGPAKTPVKVLKPANLFGDKIALQTQNGLEGGAFGGPLPAAPGIIAKAVLADPILAGSSLVNAAEIAGNIAIVQRGGGIAFATKCLNAKAAGAIACVMANNNSDSPGIFGGSDTTLNNFPCITMNQTDGNALIEAAAASKTNAARTVWLRLGDDDSLRVGQFDGGKGSSDVIMGVYVPAPGLYPMRLLWMNGGGDLNCELFYVDVNGGKHLLNDSTDPNQVKLWINRTAPTVGTMNTPVVSGGYVSISWTGAGELEMALSVTGPWFKASWQTSPVLLPTSTPFSEMYFRLRSY